MSLVRTTLVFGLYREILGLAVTAQQANVSRTRENMNQNDKMIKNLAYTAEYYASAITQDITCQAS